MALVIKNYDQRAYGVENGRNEIALFLPFFFDPLKIRDVEGHAVNKPGTTIFATHHSGVALKPDDTAISRDHPIR